MVAATRITSASACERAPRSQRRGARKGRKTAATGPRRARPAGTAAPARTGTRPTHGSGTLPVGGGSSGGRHFERGQPEPGCAVTSYIDQAGTPAVASLGLLLLAHCESGLSVRRDFSSSSKASVCRRSSETPGRRAKRKRASAARKAHSAWEFRSRVHDANSKPGLRVRWSLANRARRGLRPLGTAQ
jgi:hypothetical protein